MFVYLLVLIRVIWDDLDAAAQAGLFSYIFVVKLRNVTLQGYVFKRLESDS